VTGLGVAFFGQRRNNKDASSMLVPDDIAVFSKEDAAKKAQWRDEWERTYPVMHALTSMDPTPIAPSDILQMLEPEHRDIVEEVVVDIKETQSFISPHDVAWKLQAMYRRRSKAFLYDQPLVNEDHDSHDTHL
jgi:hypothetical protein